MSRITWSAWIPTSNSSPRWSSSLTVSAARACWISTCERALRPEHPGAADVSRAFERDRRPVAARGGSTDEAPRPSVDEEGLDRGGVGRREGELPLAGKRKFDRREAGEAHVEAERAAAVRHRERDVLRRHERERDAELVVDSHRAGRTGPGLEVGSHGEHPREQLHQMGVGVLRRRVGGIELVGGGRRPAVEHIESERVRVVAVRVEPVAGSEVGDRAREIRQQALRRQRG